MRARTGTPELCVSTSIYVYIYIHTRRAFHNMSRMLRNALYTNLNLYISKIGKRKAIAIATRWRITFNFVPEEDCFPCSTYTFPLYIHKYIYIMLFFIFLNNNHDTYFVNVHTRNMRCYLVRIWYRSLQFRDSLFRPSQYTFFL